MVTALTGYCGVACRGRSPRAPCRVPAGLVFGGSLPHNGASTRKWRNGRRAVFRWQCPYGRGGSNPPLRTRTRKTPTCFSSGSFSFFRHVDVGGAARNEPRRLPPCARGHGPLARAGLGPTFGCTFRGTPPRGIPLWLACAPHCRTTRHPAGDRGAGEQGDCCDACTRAVGTSGGGCGYWPRRWREWWRARRPRPWRRPETYFSYASQPGDYIGQGQTATLSAPTAFAIGGTEAR